MRHIDTWDNIAKYGVDWDASIYCSLLVEQVILIIFGVNIQSK